MSIIRVNLHHSFESFKRDNTVTCPLTHAGYYDLIEAKPGDILLIAIPTSMVGAVAVVESNYLGYVDYYSVGGRLSLEKRTTVKTKVLAYFDNLSQEEFMQATDTTPGVFKSPFFSYKFSNYDKAALRDLINNQIIKDLEN